MNFVGIFLKLNYNFNRIVHLQWPSKRNIGILDRRYFKTQYKRTPFANELIGFTKECCGHFNSISILIACAGQYSAFSHLFRQHSSILGLETCAGHGEFCIWYAVAALSVPIINNYAVWSWVRHRNIFNGKTWTFHVIFLFRTFVSNLVLTIPWIQFVELVAHVSDRE